ncbi:hypothetical protein FACS1894139_12490 [Planctomycetales bacterium]|nr:hypothetical protein FACS1894108_01910 [Planctomycetales bacterium]GHT06500.1 hypothetical protein FACS1894139_12490 [Planctomycetales bacterium]
MKNLLLAAFLWSMSLVAAADYLQVGDAVPEFPANAEWFVGGAQKINDFGDKKLLVLYFGKAGCPSCDEFAPHLYRLLRKYPQELRVILVNPKIAPSAEVADYAKERKLGDYPIMRDPDDGFVSRFIGKIHQFPYTALVGADGKLLWFGRSKFHEQVTAEVERALGKLSAETVAPVTNAAAVVVGVDAPPTLPTALRSPSRDSAAIAAALEKRGYAVTRLAGKVLHAQIGEALTKSRAAVGDAGQVLFFFSGDALEIRDGKDVAIALSDGDLTFGEIAALARPEIFIVDAPQVDALSGINDGVPSAERIFNEMTKNLAAAFPQSAILMSAARFDRSQLNAARDGTLFAQALTAALDGGAATLNEILRAVNLQLSDYSRRSGVLQSAALWGKNQALKTKNEE